MWGRRSSLVASDTTEKDPVISACEAIIAAIVLRIIPKALIS